MGEIKKLNFLVRRNIKLYFKDKMMFFVSLITPLILVVLFLTFLGRVYKDSLIESLPEGVELSKNIVNAFTGGWLFSSIIATSCITVAFCSNLMVMDKVSKTRQDLQIAPIKKSTLQISYILSNFLTTLIICLAIFVVSLVYLAIVGWYLSFVHILLILADTLLLTLFGTLIASLIGFFISSQGALSAVCTLVSSMYGFLCGAYMPIQSMSSGIQAIVGFFPGTYGTVLFRQGYMNGVLKEMEKTLPADVIENLRKGFDGTAFFFKKQVPTWAMFLVVICSCVVLFGLILLVVFLKNKKRSRKAAQ